LYKNHYNEASFWEILLGGAYLSYTSQNCNLGGQQSQMSDTSNPLLLSGQSWLDRRHRRILRLVLNRSILFFTFLAIPTAISSVTRAITQGWQPVFGMQIGILLLMLVVSWRRRRISSAVKAAILISSCVLVAWGGLYTYGVMAPAGHWFSALAVFLIGMAYNVRGAYIATGILLAGMMAIAFLVVGGQVEPLITPVAFITSPNNWVVELLCALLFAAVVLPAVRDYKRAITTLTSKSDLRRNKIGYLAEHDQLTGLPLMRIARDRLNMACSRARRSKGRAAVLFIDLDGFKDLNDAHGHEAGDVCLKTVATRLSERLRAQDTVARVGGDEFVVVLDEVSESSEACQLAADLIQLIGSPIPFVDAQLRVGASIGIATYPDNAQDARVLQKLADRAMYDAKHAGKNRYVVSQAAPEKDGPTVTSSTVGIDTDVQSQPSSGRLGLRESIVDRSIVVMCLVIYPVAFFNFWRIAANNAAPNFLGLLVALALVTGLTLGRRKIPMLIKSTLICSIGLVLAIPGVLISGLAAPAAGWGFAASLFLCSVIFDMRVARIIVPTIALTLIAAGYGFLTGVLQYRFDVSNQSIHPGTWLVFLSAGAAVFAIYLSVWSLYKKTTADLLLERTHQIHDLQKLAEFDQLTGLPLMRLATRRLNQTCRRARRSGMQAAVVFIDLDGFKEVNDKYGHEAGDYCLGQVSQRMTGTVREVDTVARIGGDEFLVVIDSVTDREKVAAIAQKLIDTIRQPIRFDAETFSVSASLGIALYPVNGSTMDELRHQADTAMYNAKHAGKGCFEFVAA